MIALPRRPAIETYVTRFDPETENVTLEVEGTTQMLLFGRDYVKALDNTSRRIFNTPVFDMPRSAWEAIRAGIMLCDVPLLGENEAPAG